MGITKQLILLSILLSEARACMLIIVGKNATTDGSLMVAHTDDAGGSSSDIRLIRVPAADWPAGSKRPVYSFNGGYPRLVSHSRGPEYAPVGDQKVYSPMLELDQIPHTFGYWDHDYGLVNDQQLSIGETTCGARTVGWAKDHPGGIGFNVFGIAELTKIALERCDSARCAITLMGDLSVEHGFFSEDSGNPERPGYRDSAECLGIVDRYGEAWMFHVMTGPQNSSAVWVAQRVADDEMVVSANQFVIREVDLSKPEYFLGSSNMVSFAQSEGWYDPARDGPFDFTKAYLTVDAPAVAALYALYAGRRAWRAFDMVAPSLNIPMDVGYQRMPTYPFGVVPDKLLTIGDIKTIMRDHFEGTVLDMTKGNGAGPYGNPNRFGTAPLPSVPGGGGWERSISIFRAVYCHIATVRPTMPNEIGGVLRFGFGPPHGAVFMPLYGAQNNAPESFRLGMQSKYDPNSAWQAFGLVNNWRGLNWAAMSVDVVAKMDELDALADERCAAMEATALNSGSYASVYQSAYNTNKYIVQSWWDLAWVLVSKYSDGYILFNESSNGMRTQRYPEWWLKTTEFVTFPTHYNPPAGCLPNPQAQAQAQTQNAVSSLSGPVPLAASSSSVVFSLGFLALWTILVVGVTRAVALRQKKGPEERSLFYGGYGSVDVSNAQTWS